MLLKRYTFMLDYTVADRPSRQGNSLSRSPSNWSVKSQCVRLGNNSKDVYYWIYTTDLYYWMDEHFMMSYTVGERKSQQVSSLSDGQIIDQWKVTLFVEVLIQKKYRTEWMLQMYYWLETLIVPEYTVGEWASRQDNSLSKWPNNCQSKFGLFVYEIIQKI